MDTKQAKHTSSDKLRAAAQSGEAKALLKALQAEVHAKNFMAVGLTPASTARF